MEYRLTTPCTAEDLAPLKAGDTVLLPVWCTLPAIRPTGG